MIQQGAKLKALNNNPLQGNEVAPPLVVGKEYDAKEVYVCQCGQDHVDVGLASKYNWITCYKCKKELPRGEKIHWCHPTRFEVL
jgi:hypothetical protein